MNKLGFMQPNFFKVTHSYPSSIISCIHNAPPHGAAEVSRITSPVNESTTYRVLKDVHLSTQLLDGFLDLAKDNTSKDLETCGVLGAFLKEGTYYVTTLIIPKQDSTSSTCQAVNEEEIFAIQNERSLFPVGWIHTHPSQSCFMSSVDLHTQYSYQVMVPEAVAIVMAPTDTSRIYEGVKDLTEKAKKIKLCTLKSPKLLQIGSHLLHVRSYGYFRLSDPDGMKTVRECQETGFHSHTEPVDGASIYEDCSNIYLNPNLRLEIFDLRHQ